MCIYLHTTVYLDGLEPTAKRLRYKAAVITSYNFDNCGGGAQRGERCVRQPRECNAGGIVLLSRLIGIFLVGLVVLDSHVVVGQEFPHRPIRIITSLPGGGSDFAARVIAQAISGPLGQPVIVENRASSLATEAAMKAPPDGYTLYVEGTSFWVAPLLRQTVYDVLRDFTPITIALMAPNILLVHPSVPSNSVNELITFAKAKPGALNYGSTGTGGVTHLAMAMFSTMVGINIVHVPYKGIGPALTGLFGGEVQLVCSTAAGYAPFATSGKLKALAVTSAQPSPLFPGLPTITSVVSGYEVVQRTGLFAVGKPPKTTVNRLNREIVRAINTPEMKEAFTNAKVEPVGNTPEQFAAIVKSETAAYRKVIKDAGIKAE